MNKFSYRSTIVMGLAFLFLIQCKYKNNTVYLDGMMIKGDIDSDTTYNGLIKFYDQKSGKLLYEGNYINGIPQGKYQKYHWNGKLNYMCSYVNGKILGYTKSFDSLGTPLAINYLYYDLPVGPIMEYTNGKIRKYFFYSFDGDNLFKIDYDSVEGHKITDIQQKFFFYHFRNVTTIESSIEDEREIMKGFVYLIHPPLYDFNYELVIIDDKYTVKEVIKKFDDESQWATFNLNPLYLKENSNQFYAFKLIINDSINNYSNTMFKILR